MNKYLYLHVVQANYGHGHWQDLYQSENRAEAMYHCHAQLEAEPPHLGDWPYIRIIRRRVPRNSQSLELRSSKEWGTRNPKKVGGYP